MLSSMEAAISEARGAAASAGAGGLEVFPQPPWEPLPQREELLPLPSASCARRPSKTPEDGDAVMAYKIFRGVMPSSA